MPALLCRVPIVCLLAASLAGAEGDARTVAWAAWHAAEARDRDAIPVVRASLDAAGGDPEGRRLAMVALDSLIRLNAPADLALIRCAEALGGHVQALILASRGGEQGAAWAREAAERIGASLERGDQRALLDMVASQGTATAAASLWRDGTAALRVVVRDPPDANAPGAMGMFGSRSGGGRKRVAGEPWPEAVTYRLRRQGGEPLPGLLYGLGWERTRDAGGGTDRPQESQPVRLALLAAMVQLRLDRPVAAPEVRRTVTCEWRPGSDQAAAARTAQAHYRADWARFLADLATVGLAPAAPAVQFLPMELVDARRSGQEPLEAVDGISWQLAPPRPLDPEEARQRAAFEQDMWRMNTDASLRALLQAMSTDDAPAKGQDSP